MMAFKVVADQGGQNPMLEPAWIAGGFSLPDPPVIANGMVFALSTGENAVQQGGEKKRLLNTHPAVFACLGCGDGERNSLTARMRLKHGCISAGWR